jgi:hypothetical protein
MGIDQRRQAAQILRHHLRPPGLLGEDALDHQRVDQDQGVLHEGHAQDGHLLIIEAIGRDLATLAVIDEAVGAVPVLDDLQALMDLAADRLIAQVAAKEDRLDRLAEFGERRVGGGCCTLARVKRRRVASGSAVPSRSAVANLTISSYCWRISTQLTGRVSTGWRCG